MRSPFSKFIKYLSDAGRPRSLVRTRRSSWGGISRSPDEPTLQDLRKYWNYYHEGTVFASINASVFNVVMVGYTIESEDPEARKFIENFCDDVDLEGALLEATRHVFIFGDAYIEKRKLKNGDIGSLFVIDPRTMVIDYDEFGRIVSYHQEIGGSKIGELLSPDDIIHLRFLPIPGSPYGTSFIEPNIKTIDRKIQTDEAIFNAIKRHGTRKIVAYVGSEKDGQIPPDAVMDDITEKLENINEINEFVVPWMIKLDTIDESGVEGVQEYFNLFQTQLVVGLMCPEEALGLGRGSTEATARIKAVLWERMIRAFQYTLSKDIRNQLFSEVLKRKGFVRKDDKERAIRVNLRFNSVTEEDEAMTAKWLANLISGFKQGQLPFTRNEIRQFIGLPPRDDMDDLPEGKHSDLSEKPTPVKEEISNE